MVRVPGMNEEDYVEPTPLTPIEAEERKIRLLRQIRDALVVGFGLLILLWVFLVASGFVGLVYQQAARSGTADTLPAPPR